MVMIVWYLDLQLPMQSVPITTKVVSSYPVHNKVYSIKHYVLKFVILSGPCRAAEQAEEFVKRVWEAGWRVVHHHHLPDWLQDNDFFNGYT
jgi:hypothetical protein